MQPSGSLHPSEIADPVSESSATKKGLRSFFVRHRKVLLVALLLRLAIMPFFGSGDQGGDMWRADRLLFHGDASFVENQAWTRAIVGVVGIGIAAVGTPGFGDVIPEHGIASSFFNYNVKRYQAFWSNFASQPRFMVAQALFKVVYLPFDLLIAFLLATMCRGRDRLAVRLWLFNPIAIFASYMWGRFDVVLAAFILAALVAYQHRRLWVALACLLLAAMTKASVILVLPLVAAIGLAALGRWRWWVTLAAGVGFAALTWWQPFTDALRKLVEQGHTRYLMEIGFETHHLVYPTAIVQQVYLFPALLMIVAIAVYSRPRERLLPAVVISLLGYYALCHYHPHYLVWVVPFLIAASVGNPRMVGLLRVQGLLFGLQFIFLQGLMLLLPALPSIHGRSDGLFLVEIWQRTCRNLWQAVPDLTALLFTGLFAIHVLLIVKVWWGSMREAGLAVPESTS